MIPGGSTRAVAGWLAATLVFLATGSPGDTELARGQYLTAAAGCVTCHTDTADGAPRFAGGRALVTPFGTFYTPNITPDRPTGIGTWTAPQFVQAVRSGVGPDGRHYYPAFPYPSYAGMTEEDALAIRNYLYSTPAVNRPNRSHELAWYVRTRLAAWGWQKLFFTPAVFVASPGQSVDWNRGAYLVRHLGHCGECHSPRNQFGAVRTDRELAGNPAGPDGKEIPSIRSDGDADVADWTTEELETFLDGGMLPDGDFVGAGMGEIISEETGRLTPADRRAIATYLKALPPMRQPMR